VRDIVNGVGNFVLYSMLLKQLVDTRCTVSDNPLGLDLKIFLGALGMSGLTAYSSLYGIRKPKEGQAIDISAASGAVGRVVGQLSKREDEGYWKCGER